MKTFFKRNNINILGKGEQVIIFAHGFGCSQSAWKRIVPAFTDDYKLVLFDYVGAGKSDISAYDKERYSTLAGYAQDILEICDELNLKDVVFIGHSVSSMIGALASIKEPAFFKQLIFITPSPSYINEPDYAGGFDREDIETLLELMDEDYTGWAKLLSPKLIGSTERTDLTEELEDSFCITDNEILKQFAKTTFLSDNRKDLSHISVKSVTLQCSDDIIAPPAAGQYIYQHTPGNAMITLKATGHCPHMSAPEETIAAIKSFL